MAWTTASGGAAGVSWEEALGVKHSCESCARASFAGWGLGDPRRVIPRVELWLHPPGWANVL